MVLSPREALALMVVSALACASVLGLLVLRALCLVAGKSSLMMTRCACDQVRRRFASELQGADERQ